MKNVLLVDDDAAFLNSLAELLRVTDDAYNVYTAEDGEQASDIIKAIPVDLLITDLRMPVMDGWELLRRTIESHPRMPVIAMSACGDALSVQEAGRKGCFYFDKPLDINELFSTIRALLFERRNSP